MRHESGDPQCALVPVITIIIIIIILYRLGIVNKSFCENSPTLPYFNQSDQYVYNLFI